MVAASLPFRLSGLFLAALLSPAHTAWSANVLLDGFWDPSMADDEQQADAARTYHHVDGREIEIYQDGNGYTRIYVMKGLQSYPLEDGYYELFNYKLFPITIRDKLVDSTSMRLRVEGGYVTEFRTADELNYPEYY